jgi:microcystin-dependent protein
MAYNSNLPADTTAPEGVRENFRALKEDKIVAAASAISADTAVKLTNARNISLEGDATGSAAFDGSTDVSITVDVINANTATRLENAHTINGVAFDGTTDIMIPTSVPVGTVIWHASSTPPLGFLECDGSVLAANIYPALVEVLGTTYGDHGQLPDLRGEFIRGWDHGRGIDAGRSFGIHQDDMFKSHNHPRNPNNYAESIQAIVSQLNNSWIGQPQGGYSLLVASSTGNSGGVETRPRNISFLPCIKY